MTPNLYFKQQVITFICLCVGYTFFVYVRKSFSFAAAIISTEQVLGKSQLGLIASSQSLAYTIGKFSSGILADKVSAKLLFFTGLLFSGISAVVFIVFENVWMFSLLWFLNGLAGGPGWPACAKFLKAWYPASQLGTLWSALSTSMNVAGSVGPLVAIYIVSEWGWRTSMCLPGVICIVLSVISLLLLKDTPSDMGLPDLSSMAKAKKTDQEEDKNKLEKMSENLTLIDILSPFFLKVCVCYLVTMCIRTASLDWGQLYLIQDRGHSQITGSGFTICQEVGGIVGSITAGYLSDRLVSLNKLGFLGNSRILVVLANSVIVAVSLFFLVYAVTSSTPQLFISTIGFCLGFSLYGSIAMYGVVAVESAPTHLSGRAHSIAAASANVGMVLSGLPLSSIAKLYEWEGAFYLLTASSILPILLSLSAIQNAAKLIDDRQPKKDQ